MKLRTKIFLIFSVMATVPLLIITIFSYNRYTQTTYQRIDDISVQLFENATETANRTLDSIVQTTSLFNFYYNDGSTVIQNMDLFTNPNKKPSTYEYYEASWNFNRTCQNRLYADENIYGIYIITPCGYVFSYSNQMNGSIKETYDFQNTDWFQDTLELDGKMFVSTADTHSIFTGKQRSVFFSQCLKDVYTHETVGVLVVDCNPEIFDLSSANTMPDITLLTIDNTTTDDVLYTNYYDIDRIFNEADRKVMHADLKLSPLRLTAVVDYESLFQEFNVTGALIISIFLVCMTGFLIIAYFVSRFMVRPIEDLSQQMKSQKGSSLKSSTQYHSRNDEIGTLYDGYNTMVDSLNSSIKQDYRDKLVLLDAQMKSLEARINSHFLFNTLEAINSMAEIDGNDNISTMSLALGNMFRYALKTQSERVTINDELNHVYDYVSIQQIRFDYQFQLVIDMTEEFRQLKVLKLILQPLVENALYHGLKSCTCGSTITISGHADDRYLYIDVLDDGQGIDHVQMRDLRRLLNEEASFTELGHRNKQSIGLKNIHSRIELYYGRGYGLSITSQPGKWTNIRIKLPIIKQEDSLTCIPTSSSTTKV